MFSLPSITAPSPNSFGRHGRFIFRLEPLQDVRGRLRRHPLGAEQILDPQGNPAHRGRITRFQPRIRRPRLLQRDLGGLVRQRRSAHRPRRSRSGRTWSDRLAVISPLRSASRAAAMVQLFALIPPPSARQKTPRARRARFFRTWALNIAVRHHIRPPLQAHRCNRSHRLDPSDVDLVQLFHETKDAGKLPGQGRQIRLLNPNPGKLCHLPCGVDVNGHRALHCFRPV